MKTAKSTAFLPLLGLVFLLAQSRPAQAAIHIYKVTFSAKAQFFPRLTTQIPNPGNSRKSTGYLIYDTVTPANSQTVEIFTNKTYRLNALLLNLIFPSQVLVGGIDRTVPPDGFAETAAALVAFQTGGSFVARSYQGVIPKVPFKIKNIVFANIAKSLKGAGSVTTPGSDRLTVLDTWTFDPLSALQGVVGSNNTNDGVAAVEVFLQGKNYIEVP